MFKSIRNRLIFAFLIMATVPILIMGMVFSYKSFSALKEKAVSHQKVEAERVGIAVSDYIHELKRVLELTSRAHSFYSLNRDKQKEILEEVLSYENRFQELTLVDTKGMELIRCNRIEVVPDNHLKDLSLDPIFKDLLKSERNFFTPVNFNNETGEPFLTIGIPLKSIYSGKTEFILLGSVRLKKLWNLLAKISHKDQTIMIVNRNGDIIGHPDPSIVLMGKKFIIKNKVGEFKDLNGKQSIVSIKDIRFGDNYLYIVAFQSVKKALILARSTIYITILVVVSALVFALFSSLLIINNIIKPLQHLSNTAREIEKGNFNLKVNIKKDDEVGELGHAFNEMTRRLRKTIENLEKKVEEKKHEISERKRAEAEKSKLEFQLSQSRKMEAIGTLAGGIAHDFNNILSIIIGYAEILMDEDSSGYTPADALTQIIKAGDRARELVQQILTFSRESEIQVKPLSPDILIKDSLKLLRPSFPSTIKIKEKIDHCGKILTDETKFNQIIMNLCTNSYHSMKETGGTISIRLSCLLLSKEEIELLKFSISPGPYISLEISDSGSGIKKDNLARIFDPYFTTKKQGEGTGLGLSIVHGIVKSSGGDISVYSEEGRGTSFKLYFPIVNSDSKTIKPREYKSLPGGNESIMVVDDEKSILIVLNTILEELGYSVRTFQKSKEAFKEFKKNPDYYEAVITDMTMPELTGAELARDLLALKPSLPIIICSGFSDLINEKKALSMGIKAFIYKPVFRKKLSETLRNVLDDSQLEKENLNQLPGDKKDEKKYNL